MIHDGNGGGFFDRISVFIGKQKQIQAKVVYVPNKTCKTCGHWDKETPLGANFDLPSRHMLSFRCTKATQCFYGSFASRGPMSVGSSNDNSSFLYTKATHYCSEHMERAKDESIPSVRTCRLCGCTDANCSQCIKAQGHACHWVELDLCSRCQDEDKS